MSWSSRVASALVVGSVVSRAVGAQGIRPRFGVATGWAAPTGDYHATANGDGFNTAWQGMAFVAFRVPGWPVALRLDGTYGRNSANDQLKAHLTTAFGVPSDERATLLGANLDLTYPASSESRASPYLVGGVGVYHVTISVTSGGSTADDGRTRFAWNLGGGITYRLGGVAPFLEARYVDVGAGSGFPATTVFPITAGIRFGSR